MARADLGRKHSCTFCGAKFYDLRREPATCPACGAVVQAVEGPRSKRAAPVPQVAAKTVDKVDEEVGAGIEEGPERDENDHSAKSEEDEEEVDDDGGGGAIEDVAELGEDGDVVGVVREPDEKTD